MSNAAGLQKAGAVEITELNLISSKNTVFDLKEFLVEFNLYEDIFSNNLYGDILLSDSRNLIDLVPIIGEEYLNVEFVTPSFKEAGHFIKKTFRVFKVSNRKIVRDNNTQLFVLHFVSMELIYDIQLPLFKSFKGKGHQIVNDLYFDYLAASRNFLINEKGLNLETPATTLVTINETSNDIKFVSPGWTPFRCINWIATKSIPSNGKANNFLFFETNRAFYFGSLETIYKDAIENKNILGVYTLAPNNIREKGAVDIMRELTLVQSVEMIESTDHIKNYTNGYLANRLITLDILNKKYEQFDYDYVSDYANHYHTSGKGNLAKPNFDINGPRNPASSISFYPINSKLFNDFKGNVSEKIKDIYGNRKSSMIGTTNIKLNLAVPGRTDIEAGRMIYFKFPALGPASEEDLNMDKIDKEYSGYYLITAIHHRVTFQEHTMSMEVIKDSLRIEE